MIEFGDGPRLDSSGPLRVEEVGGQVYVLGDGMAFPTENREAGEALLRDIESRTVFMNMKVFKSPGSRARVNAALDQIAEEMEEPR